MIQCFHSESLFSDSQVFLPYKVSPKEKSTISRRTRNFPSFLHIMYVINNASCSHSHTCIHISSLLAVPPGQDWNRGTFFFLIFNYQKKKKKSISQSRRQRIRQEHPLLPQQLLRLWANPTVFSTFSSGIVLILCISFYFGIFMWCCRKADYYCNRVTSASI